MLKEYNSLLAENSRLKDENLTLRMLLGVTEKLHSELGSGTEISEGKTIIAEQDDNVCVEKVTKKSDLNAKINVFMSLFKGRDDVYALRWENIKKGNSGYSPVCLNQWQTGLCLKPKGSCITCVNKLYAPLDEHVIENHLRGNIVAGIYPMLPDENCHFLAMDFDGPGWQKDITTLRDVCFEFSIPIAVERSRSGKGGHVWFFFENSLSAMLARKFATAFLTFSMNRRHEIQFRSYDRLFPSQDTIPKGGLGNLIALPLQKEARQYNNSEFVDSRFESYADQWLFLSSIEKISQQMVENLISQLCRGDELGVLKVDEEETQSICDKPVPLLQLLKNDFPQKIAMEKSNMLHIPKAGISQKALNRLKRFASFKNPEFYKRQAIRLTTYGHPRIICCADEEEDVLCLPRGCENDLLSELTKHGVDVQFIDRTNGGRKIKVSFNGTLRPEQAGALDELMNFDTGILSGTTAFGKTVVALKMIAERKVNTLILVDKVSLLSQWKEKLSEFLSIKEQKNDINCAGKKKAKKRESLIGQLGAGKNTLGGIVDIAVMQSLSRQGEVKECVKNYGMIIADECHHAPAFTYEKILKTTNAKYVYGLTATPTRKDGHHPILYMQCGPIRYRDDAKKQAAQRPFEHFIIPRFTSLRIPLDCKEKDITIHELYTAIVESEMRNRSIVDDVVNCYTQGRNCLVLSQRTAHVEKLAQKIKEEGPDVVMLMGGMGTKKTREVFDQIRAIPADKNLVLVATGSFIGEGFDEPRLDTLFLSMPISWKGTLQQYAGRLHRLCVNKKEVRIYDYVDIQVKMLEKM